MSQRSFARYNRRGGTPDGDLDGMNDELAGLFDLTDLFDLGGSPQATKLDETRRTSLIVDPPDGRIPALTAEAQKRNEAFRVARLRPAGPEDRDSEERCLGTGPAVTGPTGGGPTQILQSPGYVVIVPERYNDRRIIPLDGRPHLPQSVRQRGGDSRGRWESNTLVVDTTNFIDRKPMPNSGSEGFSEKLHLIERFTRTGPDRLLYEFTVEDSATYTRPYTARIPLSRWGQIFEYACQEGNYGLANILAGARMAERTGATISGRIDDAIGEPLANVNVQAALATYHQSGFRMLQTIAAATTDEHGEYRLYPVPPGEYYLRAGPPPTPGTPPGHQTVKTFYPSETDATTSTPLQIRAGEMLTGRNIRMRTAVGYKLSGLVTSSGSQVTRQPAVPSGSQLAVTPATLIIATRDVSVPDDVGPRVVGVASLDRSAGRFEIANVLPGTYDLYARVNDLQNWLAGGAPVVFGRIPIEVRDRNIDGVRIVVHPSVDVKGTVTFNGTATRTSVRVALHADGSSTKFGAYQDVAQRPTTVNQDGSFTVTVVPEGRFRVELLGLASDAYVADVRQGRVNVYDSGLEVGIVPPGPIQIRVNSGAGSIQGVVHDEAGRPVSSATVALAPDPRRRENRALYADATSDSMGNFTIKGIAPGEYTLFAWEERVWMGAYRNPGFIGKYAGRGRAVKVAPSSTVAATVTVIPASK